MDMIRAVSYSIGWIAALPIERAAAIAMLDDRHEQPDDFTQHPSDMNAYSWGRIGKHNIVIASLPNGVYGETSATATALNLLSSLPNIKIGLMVGIGGGISRPDLGHDIRLGDVAVSKPSGTKGGVVQYDLGKAISDNKWEPKGTLNTPPIVLLNALSALEAEHTLASSRIPEILEEMWKTRPLTKKPTKGRSGFVHQGFENDRLFPATYIHVGGQTCQSCRSSEEIQREERGKTDPEIHYGIIASGNTLVKDAAFRDKVARATGDDCICLEMEAAGLMNYFPCLVVRGICDYADSHKNDRWQPYAAATAAAFAKELLQHVPLKQLQDTPPARTLEKISEAVQDIQSGVSQVLGQVSDIREDVTDRFLKPHANQCLRDLCATDPRMDKERLQDTKGGLMRDIYGWIVENAQFLQFLDDPNRNLLWIRGDPGKGKTMLMCGIVDELQKSFGRSVVYFFCQETDANLNSAASVLRGIIFLLASSQPLLLPLLQREYDKQGSKLFEGSNVWFSLKGIFESMVQCPHWKDTIIMVDALDECVVGRGELLDLAVQLAASTKIKWIITSRNSEDVGEKLRESERKIQLHLELNQELISKAVEIFIEQKTEKLAAAKRYNVQTTSEVKSYLLANSDGTFLWVALVCAELRDVHEWDVAETLRTFPGRLRDLYGSMMDRIRASKSSEKCIEILAIITLAYKPLHLTQLKVLIKSITDFDKQQLKIVIGLCGSFLTIRKDTVYFIHQSAKDYLRQDATKYIFPKGITQQHLTISTMSIEVLMSKLERNPYHIEYPGTLINEIVTPHPDPLLPIRYACIYWVGHLGEAADCIQNGNELSDGGIVDNFIRQKYLYWLESLSLLRAVPEGVRALSTLRAMTKCNTNPKLSKLLRDADRFLRYFQVGLETAPLQIYSSALIFSPKESEVRCIFDKEQNSSISLVWGPNSSWDACLQTLERGNYDFCLLAFLPEEDRLISCSSTAVKIWDIATGSCLQTSRHLPNTHVFALNSGKVFLTQSQTPTEEPAILDIKTATYQNIKSHNVIQCAAFSLDGRYLALCSRNDVVVWDVMTNRPLETLKGHVAPVRAINFSPDGHKLASGSDDDTLRVWQKEGNCKEILRGHVGGVNFVIFSHHGQNLASAGRIDKTIRIWDITTGCCLKIHDGHEIGIWAIAFSREDDLIATGSDRTIKIWNVISGSCVRTFLGHNGIVSALVFPPNSEFLLSAAYDGTIKIWDYIAATDSQPPRQHTRAVTSMQFSGDKMKLVTGSFDGSVKIWCIATGECLKTCYGHQYGVAAVCFSSKADLVASGDSSGTVRIWDSYTGICLRSFRPEGLALGSVSAKFLPGDHEVATPHLDGPIPYFKIWDIETGTCTRTVEDLAEWVPASQVNYGPTGIERFGAEPSQWEFGQFGRWLTYNQKPFLWLPAEYEPSEFFTSGSLIALGCEGGQVLVIDKAC